MPAGTSMLMAFTMAAEGGQTPKLAAALGAHGWQPPYVVRWCKSYSRMPETRDTCLDQRCLPQTQ